MNWTPIIAIVVAVVVGALGYSLYSFYSSGTAERGIVVCNPNDPAECLWQDHIHALLLISVDGEAQDLPIEKGPLGKTHTHEERNVLHWHSSLKYDPARKEVVDKDDLTVRGSLDSVGVELPEGARIFVGKSGVWQKVGEDYAWSDRDIIFVAKDSRSDQDILAELRAADIRFPYLGAG